MSEVLQNYLNEFVKPHIEDKKGNAFLKEQIDIVTQEKEPCGYDPNVKFFTMDNYDDKFKEQSINRLDRAVSDKGGHRLLYFVLIDGIDIACYLVQQEDKTH